MRPILLALVLALLLGCNAGETAIRLRLVPTPELNSEQQVLEFIDTVTLTLDAPQGFQGVPDPRVFTVRDFDNDQVNELMLTQALGTSLPTFRLSPGHNQESQFKAAVRGLAGSEVLATGTRDAVSFLAGQTRELMIDFNLLGSYRPLRVVATSPRNTETGVPSALARIEVEFSKTIDAASLGTLLLTYQGTAGDVPLTRGQWTHRTIETLELGVRTKRSEAVFNIDPGCTLSPGTYRLVAGSEIMDETGVGLDQDATRKGSDPYQGTFTVGTGTARSTPCEGQVDECLSDKDCMINCAEVTCPYVCDLGTRRCVENCNQTSYCPGETLCGPDGVCYPVTGAVRETVTCRFLNTKEYQSCEASLATPTGTSQYMAGCTEAGSCTVSVVGRPGTVVVWTGSCLGKPNPPQTTIDGKDKTVEFPCP